MNIGFIYNKSIKNIDYVTITIKNYAKLIND